MSTESHQAIEEAASDWLARRSSGSWSSEDQRAFDAWFNQSMRHRVSYWRLESAWESTQRLKALGAGIQSDRPPPPGQWNLSPFFTQCADEEEQAAPHSSASANRMVRAFAASLVLAAAVGMAAWFLWPDPNRYETLIGATASLPMADGSKITLNTASEIKVAMSGQERRIELEQGEAFFEVAKDPSRPFVVVAGDKRVIAVGTKFSVRRDLGSADGIEVVVTEGIVRVEPVNGKGIHKLAAQPLTAGTIARANRGGVMIQKKDISEAEEQLAWRSGVLIFRDSTLADAAAEFNRYNPRKMVIEDELTAGLRIMGSFRATNVDAFVRLLQQGYPVETSIDEKRIVIRAR